jgi:hypothetical protein
MNLDSGNPGGHLGQAIPGRIPFLSLEIPSGEEARSRKATQDPFRYEFRILSSTLGNLPAETGLRFMPGFPYRVERQERSGSWLLVGGCVAIDEHRLCFYLDEGYCVVSLGESVVPGKEFLFGWWSPDRVSEKKDFVDPVGAWVAESQGPVR